MSNEQVKKDLDAMKMAYPTPTLSNGSFGTLTEEYRKHHENMASKRALQIELAETLKLANEDFKDLLLRERKAQVVSDESNTDSADPDDGEGSDHSMGSSGVTTYYDATEGVIESDEASTQSLQESDDEKPPSYSEST